MVIILFLLLTACSMVTHYEVKVDDNQKSATWPLDKHAKWVGEDMFTLLFASSWYDALELAKNYPSPYDDILRVEIYHSAGMVDKEVSSLKKLVDSGFMSEREIYVMLSRHSLASLLKHKDNPFVRISIYNKKFYGNNFALALKHDCALGNKYACVSSKNDTNKITKIYLLYSSKSNLSLSSSYFKSGFLLSVAQSGENITVKNLDISNMKDNEIIKELNMEKPDWIIGPLEKDLSLKLYNYALNYKTLYLSACEDFSSNYSYCFPSKASSEVRGLVARLENNGFKKVVLVKSGSNWQNVWIDEFRKYWPYKFLVLNEPNKESDLPNFGENVNNHDAVIMLSHLNDTVFIKKYLMYISSPPLVYVTSSLLSDNLYGKGLMFMDTPLLLGVEDGKLSAASLDINKTAHSKGLVYKRFAPWGFDAFVLISQGFEHGLYDHRLPYDGGSGLTYLHGHNVIYELYPVDVINRK